MIGGKIVGQGTYGCVFNPPLLCKKKQILKQSVGKITDNEDYVREVNTYKILNKIPEAKNYIVLADDTCVPRILDNQVESDIDKCKFFIEKDVELSKTHQILMPYGGIPLHNISKDKLSFFSFMKHILEAGSLLLLHGIDDTWKILLLMGIGVFINHENIKYTEIMKKLADEQKLYMIIASSDYIYGTNYQFCHGYISKGMNLTQEKIIQAMGRIGRNNIQQNYSLRFRDDEQIMKIFTSEADKPEIINMNLLFNSNKNIIWNGQNFEERILQNTAS